MDYHSYLKMPEWKLRELVARKGGEKKLCEYYHVLQISAVRAAIYGDYMEELRCLVTVSACRMIMRERKGYDEGHELWLAKINIEITNLWSFICNGWAYVSRYRFMHGELVGNAMDAGVAVPRENCPEGFVYVRRDGVAVY